MKQTITYSDAGVSIDRANAAKERIKRLAGQTFNQRTLSDIGNFGGMFDAAFPGMEKPVLVASADGVGTKLKIAFLTNRHDTIGIDLVNHCTNDILVQGARPLFFMDYIATGRLEPETVASVVEGLANGCRENGCVLLGGETAEMPGFYADDEYDVAGFIVGVASRDKVIDGRSIAEGDKLIGLASSGLHTNGYSLARKILFDVAGYDVNTRLDKLDETIGNALLAPHKTYLGALDALLDQDLIKGLAHITGGGLLENIPRVLPDGTAVEIDTAAWTVPALFQLLQETGNVTRAEMFRTFNMGVGMVIFCAPEHASQIITHIQAHGETCFEIGRVTTSSNETSADEARVRLL